MHSKINLGELMEPQPGEGSGAGEEPVGGPAPGALSDPDPGVSADRPSGSKPVGLPEPGLAGFAKGGAWDSTPPSAALAAALEGAAGAGWRCEGGSRPEIVGGGRAAGAFESWACGFKL